VLDPWHAPPDEKDVSGLLACTASHCRQIFNQAIQPKMIVRYA
jgi:hypothetical protein